LTSSDSPLPWSSFADLESLEILPEDRNYRITRDTAPAIGARHIFMPFANTSQGRFFEVAKRACSLNEILSKSPGTEISIRDATLARLSPSFRIRVHLADSLRPA
jgi:hypothetical protein